MIEKYSSPNDFIVGVVSDTHIPDRRRSLHPRLIPALREQQVQLILHAGDISIPRVLRDLEEVAPVLAVRGNRDIAFGSELPLLRKLEINGHLVLLTHGHMGITHYWLDKIQHIFKGYQPDRYIHRLERAMPEASVYIFGHSHCSEVIKDSDKLYFNPGSVSIGLPPSLKRSWGLLIFGQNSVQSTIFELDDWKD
jgi:putative phosphoesterase